MDRSELCIPHDLEPIDEAGIALRLLVDEAVARHDAMAFSVGTEILRLIENE